MTVFDLYVSVVLLGIVAVGGACVYKAYRDQEERFEQIERTLGTVYHSLPPPSTDDVLNALRRETTSAARP